MMKSSIFLIAALLGLSYSADASSSAPVVNGVAIDSLKLEHRGNLMAVDIALDLSGLDVSSNRAVLLTPRLINGNDSVDLPAVGIYGRRRYYYYVRNGESMLSGSDEASYKASQRPDRLAYNKTLPYQEWMNGAQLSLLRSEYGCCSSLLARQAATIGDFSEIVKFFPELVYVRPEAERVKSRSLEGSAYIDFPVNRADIDPDYRRNSVELGKIRATIDSVRSDRDITITSVWLKGFASPESSYENNENLAIGRTDALKQYILNLYHFTPGIIATDHEAEDWDGLRRFVANSDLSHKQEILDIIDSDREPDPKEWVLKTTYPDEYRFLLDNCYPALRHTDYRIAYTIRDYSDADEIRRIIATQPQKLSLNEFYIVAQECEPGSDEFTEVFETAVRMYPSDETANLNAANAAMRRGDNAGAQRYLAKAGDTPEAVYARGALAIRQGDYDTARACLQQAADAGLDQAAVTLSELQQKNK